MSWYSTLYAKYLNTQEAESPLKKGHLAAALFISLSLILTQIPAVHAAYLQTDRNPPYYYEEDTVYIYGGGFPPNQMLRMTLVRLDSSPMGQEVIFFTSRVPSTYNAWVSFSFGPIKPTWYYSLPVGWYNILVWSSWYSYASTRFYYGRNPNTVQY